MKKTMILALVSLLGSSIFAVGEKITLTDAKGREKTFDTISAALKGVKGSGEYKITLPKGTYNEILNYNGGAKITIVGDTDAAFGEDVVIAAENNGELKKGKSADGKAIKDRCLFEFEGTGNLTLMNVTLHNTYVKKSNDEKNTQAEALGFDSTGNLAAYNCSFKSYQDTIRTVGKAWFYGCHIEGDVDFIWMEQTGKVALYENCRIRARYNPNVSSHTAYVCAPRMNMANLISKGIVILNSDISCDEGERTYLARTPWKEGYYSQVAYIGCTASGIDSGVWHKEPLTAKNTPRTVIGWKMDKATAENMGLSVDGRDDVIDDETAKTEYGGRAAILNRTVSTSGIYKKESKPWNVAELAQKLGWNVAEDKSQL